jgi:hypothetical protein
MNSTPNQMSKKPTILILIACIGLGLLILVAPFWFKDNLSPEAVALFKALIWPLFAIMVLMLFPNQVTAVLSAIAFRIHAGGAISIWGVTLGELQKGIVAPAPGGPVTLANIAILHTSWFSEKWTQSLSQTRAPGRYYRFDAVIVAPNSVLDRIGKVVYTLGRGQEDGFPEDHREQIVTDRQSNFKLRDTADGSFILRAKVSMGDQTLELNRFLNLTETGPRI